MAFLDDPNSRIPRRTCGCGRQENTSLEHGRSENSHLRSEVLPNKQGLKFWELLLAIQNLSLSSWRNRSRNGDSHSDDPT